MAASTSQQDEESSIRGVWELFRKILGPLPHNATKTDKVVKSKAVDNFLPHFNRYAAKTHYFFHTPTHSSEICREKKGERQQFHS